MEQPTALAEELETAQPNGPANEFKTCWAGPEKELGFGLAGKSRKLRPCWEDLHPEARGPYCVRQTITWKTTFC